MDRYLSLKCFLLLMIGIMRSWSVATAQDPGTDYKPNSPPAIFVFGDSVVDPGNNNFIANTLAKANYLYNGMDFPGGPSGRFCNGRTVVDVICDIVRMPYIPACLNPLTNGSSILRESTTLLEREIARLSMDMQIGYFRRTLDQLNETLGEAGATDLVNKSIAWIAMGNNDFINNYYLATTNTSLLYTPAQFIVHLIDTFSQQLETLFNLGFRKVFVTVIGPLGCTPDQLALARSPDCVNSTNEQVQTFNNGLRSLLDQLNERHQGATYVFGNVYDSMMNLIMNPEAYGFRVVNQGCCGGGMYRGQFPCQPAASLCSNRNEYVFWDAYHPTEAANIILADILYSGGPSDISPVNIQQLIDLP